MHTNSLDEAIALPTDSLHVWPATRKFIFRTKRRFVLNSICNGSYYVEKLTDEIAHKAWEHIQEIESLRRNGQSH